MSDFDHYSNKTFRPLTYQLRLLDGVQSETLSGDVSLDAKTANLLALDPGGTSRNVTLPAEEDSNGLFFVLRNTADGAGEQLVIQDDDSTAIVTLDPDTTGIVGCDGSSWHLYLQA